MLLEAIFECRGIIKDECGSFEPLEGFQDACDKITGRRASHHKAKSDVV